MHRARTRPPDGRRVGRHQIDHARALPYAGTVAGAPLGAARAAGGGLFLALAHIAHCLQHLRRRLDVGQPQRDRMEPLVTRSALDQLHAQPIGIAKRDAALAHPRERPLEVDHVGRQRLHARFEIRYGVAKCACHARACPTGSSIDEGEEGQNRSRRSVLVAVVQMVGARIVEIHRTLDQPLRQRADIEVEVRLRRAADRGHVMQPGNGGLRTAVEIAHDRSPNSIPSHSRALNRPGFIGG